jgi:hypothetical protein
MKLFRKETWKGLLSEEVLVDGINTQLGAYGDYPITGVVAVSAPAGYYFAGVSCLTDATITTLATVGNVSYTTDSYLNIGLVAGQYHPFTALVTKITLSSGSLQAWLKPLQ